MNYRKDKYGNELSVLGYGCMRFPRKHGKIAGTVGGTGNLKELYEMGYRFVNLGADVVALGQYFTKIADDAKAIRDSL